MPIQRRLPKFGFKNQFRVEYRPINLEVLQMLAEQAKVSTIDMETLVSAGFVSSHDKVKILAKGSVTTKLEVKAHAFSKKAEEAIVAAGGTVVKL